MKTQRTTRSHAEPKSRYNRNSLGRTIGEGELTQQTPWRRILVGVAVTALGILIVRIAFHGSSLPQVQATASASTPTPASPDPAAPASALAEVQAQATTKSASSHAKAAAVETLGPPIKTIGSKDAPIMMEVFSDYQCPACGSLFELTLRPMINDYVAAGKVYLVHHDFPLPMHPYGYQAARWETAAARIGKFQEIDAALYDNQKFWSADGNIEKYVAGALSAADFKRVQKQMAGCALETKPSQGCALDVFIEQDKALGNQIPVKQTPTYVFTNRGQRLAPGAGPVAWPILKQFFDSLN
jgi:protein-disulfide isomerase